MADKRLTKPVPHIDDIRGAIQDALSNLGKMEASKDKGNPYFSVYRMPLLVGDVSGELHVAWNNLRDADKLAMSEAATIEQLRKRLTELEARQPAKPEESAE